VGRSALELGFDIPCHRPGIIGREDDVMAESVDIFCVYKEAVHIEEAGADGWEIYAWFCHCGSRNYEILIS